MKKIILIVLAIIIAIVVYVLNKFGFIGKEENIRKIKNSPEIQSFLEVEVPFTTTYDADHNFPFLGGAILDVDNNGMDDMFISTGEGQGNALMTYKDGAFVDIAADVGLDAKEASYGAIATDIDNDNDTDLIVAQFTGVYVYTNNNGKFSATKLDVNIPENTQPMSVAVADINKDGLFDIYISNFVSPATFVPSTFNNDVHAKKNIMLLNKGDLKFEDVTEATGTRGTQNTFHSSFVDLDNDGNMDLMLSNNTGRVEIFQNNGDMTFELNSFDSEIGYWMGIGIGDIDKDGYQEAFFSNIGSSIPLDLTRGDLTDDQNLNLEWLLLDNDGAWTFTDITEDYQLTGYGFGWGSAFEDLDLDGELDLLVAQNYIRWPKHKTKKLPGKSFIMHEQDGGKGFYQLDDLGVLNPHYGQSPLTGDFNGDGRLDVAFINMADKARAFLNQSEKSYLKIVVPDTLKYEGAQLSIDSENGKSYTKQIIQSIGYGTDQTNDVFFGLGDSDKPVTLTVKLLTGEEAQFENVGLNSIFELPK